MDEGILRVFHKKELDTRVIGKKIYRYDTVGSTNDSAFMYALKGEKEGAAFWARAQTKGRGRLGRQWISHKDKGLYFSLILRPDMVIRDAPKITLLVALSIVQALRAYADFQFLIKWPNDIFVDNKKIGGILTEMDTEIQKVRFLVVGIGINTNVKQSELPLKRITSLKILLGKDVQNEGLLEACLKEIDRYYFQFKKGGISDVIEEARHFSCLWGKQVKINGKDEGIAVDFDKEGALVVRQHNGFLKHIFAGDVELLR